MNALQRLIACQQIGDVIVARLPMSQAAKDVSAATMRR
jgi:hypothetical protein